MSAASSTFEQRNVVTRRALLDAGREVLEEHGYTQATVQLITQKAGRAHGTFYRHFQNKELLYGELVDELYRSLQERGRATWNPEDPAGSLHASIEQFVEAYLQDRALRELLDGGSAGSEKFQLVKIQLRRSLAGDIRRGIESLGSYADLSQIDTQVTALMLASMLEGTCAQLLLHDQTQDPEVIVEHLTAVWLRALGIADRGR
ncbi:MAG: TetR/AcrR family transcriptional regulator [Aeromicrobium sp.]|uniref:TetR/AcrR family transcriptional regulator n=1 Tax=Aeromicrobium sp. TaxID=1871063 RepID=UPI002622C3EF|nr:TetR/AcrR family transcriptional regulator [Aeromicrobium sp.]MDF1705949.1 TetR/AcrR family transcriptional regulator [Aeromicrobium sp.]